MAVRRIASTASFGRPAVTRAGIVRAGRIESTAAVRRPVVEQATGQQPIRMASLWNAIANTVDSGAGAANDRHAVYVRHRIPKGLTEVVINFANVRSSSGTTTYTNGPAQTVSASLQFNGIAVPCTWGGNPVLNLAAGAVDVPCDPIPCSAFGPYMQLPDNIDMYTKHVGAFVAGAATSIPVSSRTPAQSGPDTQFRYFAAANTTASDVNAVGPFTFTGTAPTSRNAALIPMVQGRHAAPVRALLIRGDSISQGIGDTSTSKDGTGWFQEMVKTLGLPSLNLAVSGSTTTLARDDPRRLLLYKYCTDGIVFYLTNDFGLNATGKVPADMLARIDLELLDFKNEGFIQRITCSVGPSTNNRQGAGNFTSDAGQDINPGWEAGGPVDLTNQALATLRPNATGHMPFNSRRSPTAPFKWTSEGGIARTSDGTHPGPANTGRGHSDMAAEATPIVADLLNLAA